MAQEQSVRDQLAAERSALREKRAEVDLLNDLVILEALWRQEE